MDWVSQLYHNVVPVIGWHNGALRNLVFKYTVQSNNDVVRYGSNGYVNFEWFALYCD